MSHHVYIVIFALWSCVEIYSVYLGWHTRDTYMNCLPWLIFVNACVASLQSSDADVVAGPAEDGRQQQERSLGHELYQVTQQPGCPTDRVSVHTCAF